MKILKKWTGMAAAIFLIFAGMSVIHAQKLDEKDALALLDRLEKSRSGGVVQADFREKKFLPMMREPVIEAGKIAFEQPDKLLRKVDNGNLAVSDGETLWMYYPQFQQAEKYSVSGKHGLGKFFTALTKIFQLQNLKKYFRVEAFLAANGFRLELSPQEGALRKILRHASVDLGEDLRLQSSVITGSEGDRMETTYSNEKVLPHGAVEFSFAPPKGVNVATPGG